MWHNKAMKQQPFILKLITIVSISSFFITFFSIFFGAIFQTFFIFDFIFPLFFFTFFLFIIMIFSNAFYMAKHSLSPLASMQALGFSTLATQAGYTVTSLPFNHPSSAQYVIDHPTGKLLVRVLGMKEVFSNDMVQKISGSLTTLQAKEGWIVSMQTPFKENDQSFARFYNVLLMTMSEASVILTSKK